jgi:hypothetical protein
LPWVHVEGVADCSRMRFAANKRTLGWHVSKPLDEGSFVQIPVCGIHFGENLRGVTRRHDFP